MARFNPNPEAGSIALRSLYDTARGSQAWDEEISAHARARSLREATATPARSARRSRRRSRQERRDQAAGADARGSPAVRRSALAGRLRLEGAPRRVNARHPL